MAHSAWCWAAGWSGAGFVGFGLDGALADAATGGWTLRGVYRQNGSSAAREPVWFTRRSIEAFGCAVWITRGRRSKDRRLNSPVQRDTTGPVYWGHASSRPSSCR